MSTGGVMWSGENIARLTAMWCDGFSGSQIAARLGTTRNAVIGKARRIGLERRAPSPKDRKKREPRTKTVPVKAFKQSAAPRPIKVRRGRSIVFVASLGEMTKGELRAFLKQAVINTAGVSV